MSQLCSNLIQGCIAAKCDDMIYAGMSPVGYLANFDQIASMTWSGNICSGITMGTDATTQESYCFYTVQQLGNEPFNGTQTQLATGTYGNKFTHTVVIAVPDHSPAAAALLDGIANGKLVFIGQNDYHGSDGKAKYEIFGGKKGLKATDITREAYGDAEGMTIVTLTEENSPISAGFFYVTDETTTDSAVQALLCDCED